MRLNEIALVTMFILVGTGVAAHAEGFKLHDLTKVETAVAEKFEKGAYHWAIPANLNVPVAEWTKTRSCR